MPEQRAGEGQRRAPLAGAGLGGDLLDAGLGVVPGLRHGGVGLVRCRRATRLRTCSRSWPACPAPSPAGARAPAGSAARGGRPRAPARGSAISRSVLTSCRISSIGNSGARSSGPDRLQRARVQRRRRRHRQVGHDVVPVARHAALVEQELGLGHGGISWSVGRVEHRRRSVPVRVRLVCPRRRSGLRAARAAPQACSSSSARSMPPWVIDSMACSQHRRLGVVGDRQAGGRHHRQVVGAVAHGDGLLGADAHQFAHLQQHALLLGAVDDVAPGAVEQRAGEPAVGHAQRVGAREVQLQAAGGCAR